MAMISCARATCDGARGPAARFGVGACGRVHVIFEPWDAGRSPMPARRGVPWPSCVLHVAVRRDLSCWGVWSRARDF